jgi:hypothetical protein
MWLVEEHDFPLAHDLKLVALQGDCALREENAAEGSRYVVDAPDRARQACLRLVDHARATGAHLALVPEMVIPLQAIQELLQRIEANPQPLLLIGGIEGVAPAQYRTLVAQHGGAADVPDGAAGTYVNAILVALRTATQLRVFFRAKRFASGPENAGGPQLALGTGEFLVLKLGAAPFVIVPLICSEFTWPQLWATVNAEAPGLAIDLMPVVQRNQDVERRYTGPVMHIAYQNNLQTRFVLANQALLPMSSDGTCFVVAPPASPPAPGFNHGRYELWLPDTCTYKGFRIPERTGCFWCAEIVHPSGPMNAARPPVCGGRVLAVLTPDDVDLGGLSAGLMRSAAASRYLGTSDAAWPNTEPRRFYRSALVSGAASVLEGASRSTANEAFLQMICDVRPTWSTVESLVEEFVDTSALLSSGGDRVHIGPVPGGNCTVSGRSVAVLYAPAVDAALEARFPAATLLSGMALPTGIVLLKVEASSRIPRAKTVGDILRADRVSTESPELTDGPVRVSASSVSITLGDIHFCEPSDLKPSLDEATAAAARSRSSAFLPGVYA